MYDVMCQMEEGYKLSMSCSKYEHFVSCLSQWLYPFILKCQIQYERNVTAQIDVWIDINSVWHFSGGCNFPLEIILVSVFPSSIFGTALAFWRLLEPKRSFYMTILVFNTIIPMFVHHHLCSLLFIPFWAYFFLEKQFLIPHFIFFSHLIFPFYFAWQWHLRPQSFSLIAIYSFFSLNRSVTTNFCRSSISATPSLRNTWAGHLTWVLEGKWK